MKLGFQIDKSQNNNNYYLELAILTDFDEDEGECDWIYARHTIRLSRCIIKELTEKGRMKSYLAEACEDVTKWYLKKMMHLNGSCPMSLNILEARVIAWIGDVFSLVCLQDRLEGTEEFM